MNINILGVKMRLELIIISIFVGCVITTTSFCSCAGGIREGFIIGTNLAGAAIDYSMGDGVKGSYLVKPDDFNKLETNVKGLGIPPPEGKLSLFGENEMSPNCCPSTYSTSKGCVCSTPEQITFLNKRGGNRT
jgi:hypothetical protein|tara:strand:- start:1091 stop:1489 length:399 start_codon:yes stop_codon:yes gene_type:complete